MELAIVLAVALILAAYSFFHLGKVAGIKDERRRAEPFTSLAAWIFHQLWISEEYEWHVIDVQRRDGRYHAIFNHEYDGETGVAKHIDHHKGDLG